MIYLLIINSYIINYACAQDKNNFDQISSVHFLP